MALTLGTWMLAPTMGTLDTGAGKHHVRTLHLATSAAPPTSLLTTSPVTPGLPAPAQQ